MTETSWKSKVWIRSDESPNYRRAPHITPQPAPGVDRHFIRLLNWGGSDYLNRVYLDKLHTEPEEAKAYYFQLQSMLAVSIANHISGSSHPMGPEDLGRHEQMIMAMDRLRAKFLVTPKITSAYSFPFIEGFFQSPEDYQQLDPWLKGYISSVLDPRLTKLWVQLDYLPDTAQYWK